MITTKKMMPKVKNNRVRSSLRESKGKPNNKSRKRHYKALTRNKRIWNETTINESIIDRI